MSAMRHIPEEVASLRNGRWQSTLGRALRGRTLGVWGYGKIGSLVAGYGRAFAMRVLIWGREGSLTRAGNDGFEVASSREQLFEEADVLSLHLKLSKEIRGIVTRDDLARMKSDALLVNTSRAELIEAGALLDALRAGRPAFAAIDVFEDEPAVRDPLLALPNVTATPHLGYVEKDSYELYFGEAFDSIRQS
jgi:D-3-phosphoglycerate dehydrogenase